MLWFLNWKFSTIGFINLTMTDVGSVRSGLTSQMAQQQTTTISAVTATSTY